MHITADMKMVDVIQKDIQLLAVVQRLNIPLGFREKTVEEVCTSQDVDLSFFLQLSNAFHDKDYFKVEYFNEFPVEWLISYLKNAHRCYLEYRIPEIERQIINIEKEVDPNEKNVALLLNFFREYIKEFTTHIEMEEGNVFPYIEALSQKIRRIKEGQIDDLTNGPYSMERYHEDHNNIEETLYDLKNILLKYLPPPIDNCQYNNLIFDIFRLESDLMDHADLEEKVLFPRVKKMEDELETVLKNKK